MNFDSVERSCCRKVLQEGGNFLTSRGIVVGKPEGKETVASIICGSDSVCSAGVRPDACDWLSDYPCFSRGAVRSLADRDM
jgi:hypothetical protein